MFLSDTELQYNPDICFFNSNGVNERVLCASSIVAGGFRMGKVSKARFAA